MADSFIRTGASTYVLIIGVERLSDMTNRSDRSTAFLFADGAGAAVIGPSETPGIGPVVWGSDGDQAGLISQTEPWDRAFADGGDPGRSREFPVLRMEGNPVFKWASYTMAKTAAEALDRAGVRAEDLDVFVPHQANMRITDAMFRALKLPPSVVVARDIATQGNTSAASIPLAIEALLESGEATERADLFDHRLRSRPGLRRAGDPPALSRSLRLLPATSTSPLPSGGTAMPTTEEVRADLAEIVNEVAGVPADDVQLDKSFTDDLDVDSLSMVEIIYAAEEKFGVSIPDEEAKNLKTVGDAVAYIERAAS